MLVAAHMCSEALSSGLENMPQTQRNGFVSMVKRQCWHHEVMKQFRTMKNDENIPSLNFSQKITTSQRFPKIPKMSQKSLKMLQASCAHQLGCFAFAGETSETHRILHQRRGLSHRRSDRSRSQLCEKGQEFGEHRTQLGQNAEGRNHLESLRDLRAIY